MINFNFNNFNIIRSVHKRVNVYDALVMCDMVEAKAICIVLLCLHGDTILVC